MGCSEDPDVKGTETFRQLPQEVGGFRCSEDPDVKGTETRLNLPGTRRIIVAARIPM